MLNSHELKQRGVNCELPKMPGGDEDGEASAISLKENGSSFPIGVYMEQ